MKVGILTYYSSDNYGSVLQAYALRKYISNFCDAQVVDYRRQEVKNLYKIFQPMNSKFNIITNFYNGLYYNRLNTRKKAYEKFRQEYLNFLELISESLKSSNYNSNKLRNTWSLINLTIYEKCNPAGYKILSILELLITLKRGLKR